MNRVDEFVVFHPLSRGDIEAIVRLQVSRVARRLAGRKMGLVLTDGAVAHLAAAGFDPVYGARPVKRAIQTGLETPLALAVLRGEFGEEDTVVVDVSRDDGDGKPPRLTLAKQQPAGAGAAGRVGPVAAAA